MALGVMDAGWSKANCIRYFSSASIAMSLWYRNCDM